MLIIYTPMAGGLAEEALNGLAMLVGGSTFHTAINIAMTLGVGGMAYQYITGKKLESLWRFVVVSFTILFVLIGLKFPVAIIDMQQPMAVHQVDDVPLGVAVPAAFISGLGRGIAKAFDDVFHMPDEKGYNETGMIFGSRIALASSAADFGTTPQLSEDLTNYMRQCVWIAKVQVTRNLTVGQLVRSTNLMNALFEKVSPVYRVILGKQGNVSCVTAAADIKQELIAAAEKESQRFADSFTAGDRAKFDSRLSDAQNLFLNVSKTGAQLLTQNMLMNKVKNSVADTMAFTGSTAGMMNYANTEAMNNLRIAEANTFWMAGYRLPMLNACLWILIMCLFPVVIILGFSPLFKKTFSSFVMTMIWLWTWPPMFTILNFFISYYASIKTNIFGHQDGGITMANVHALNMIHSDMAFTAGFLAMAIPFIAKGITSGFAEAFSGAAQYLGSIQHGVSQSVAGQLAHGNVAVENFSGWNANYDNTSAHKHDTNFTDYRGMSTHQLASGATMTHTASGFDVINTQGAMSQMAVGIQGSQALVSSLTHNAQMAQHRGDNLRTSADSSLQSALRESNSFNQCDGNDYRSGAGVSNTDTYGINADYRSMQESVQNWNEGHDANHQISINEAIHGSFSSKNEVLGKIGALVTGASGSVSAESRHTHLQSNNIKEFKQSQEGKTFSQSFSHAVSAAENAHLDGSSSHSLSHAEQSAADFAQASSFSHQASAEYSQSQNYSQAANVAASNSQSINANMNNAFEQWAVDKKGDNATSILSGTDTQSIQTAQGWGQEFLKSGQGQSLLNQETSAMMSQVRAGSSHSTYQDSASLLSANTNVPGQFNASKQQVNAQSRVVQPMHKQQLAQAHALAQRVREHDLLRQANITQVHSASQTASGTNKIIIDTDKTKQQVSDEFKHGVVVGDAVSLGKRVLSTVEHPFGGSSESKKGK